MNHAETNRRRPRRRTALVGLLALVCAVVLSACGAKVDTVINLDDGPKGTRVITLTLSSTDLTTNVVGGVPALDASIKQHKPAQLEYNGITPAAAGAVAATFTVSFGSSDEYRQKVAAILAASGSTITPDIKIATENTLFVRGASLDENFTSLDLMGWLPGGLVTDGAVTEANKGNVLEASSNTVVHAGVRTDTGSTVSFDAMQDTGITALGTRTTLNKDGSYRREIDYTMTAAAYATNSPAFDAFFADATPPGGKLTPATDRSAGTVGWTITFDAKDADQVTKLTAHAVNSDRNTFGVTTKPAPDNAAVLMTTVVDNLDCSAICSPKAGPVTDTLLAPAEWQLVSGATAGQGAKSDGLTVTHQASGDPVVLQHSIPFQSVEVATALGGDHSVDQTLTFVATNDNADLSAGAFTTMLKPATGVGTLTATKKGATTSYVVQIYGDDPAQYNARISKYVPGAGIVVTEHAGAGFFAADYTVADTLDLASTLARNGVTDGIRYTVTVPFAQHVVTERSFLGGGGSADGRQASWVGAAGASVAVAGMTSAALVFWAVVAGLLLLAVIATFVFRRRITAAVAQRRTERQSPATTAAAAGGAVPWTQTSPLPGVEVAEATAHEFTEADLL